MILYLQYGTGTSQVHLDLVGTEITTEEINAGAFATPSQEMTQTTIRVSIEGRPNIYNTTTTIGDIINQVQVSNGRSIGARVYLYYQPANQSIVYRAKVRALAFIPDQTGGQYWKIQRHVKGEFSGPSLLGVKAAIAESIERIHRSNLVGMGVLPLVFKDGQSWRSLGLDGSETFTISGVETLTPRKTLQVKAVKPDGREIVFEVTAREDTDIEVDYYVHGGILAYDLRKIMEGK